MVSIIGQIKPWGCLRKKPHASLNIWSEYYHQCEDKSNWSMQGNRAKSFIIMPNEVWTFRPVLVITFARVGTPVMTLGNSIVTTQRTLWNVKAMPYFSETLISFFWVCGYNKLIEFTEGNLVFADVTISSEAVSTTVLLSALELTRIGVQLIASVLIIPWITFTHQELLFKQSIALDKCGRPGYHWADVNQLSNWSLIFCTL